MGFKFSRRAVKRIGWGLAALVGLLLAFNATMSWRVEAGFAARVAAIRAEGDPTFISELQPTEIPGDENAGVLFDRLTPRLDEFSKEYAAFYNTPLGKEFNDVNESASATSEQLEALRTILDKYADLEQMIAAAAACEAYASTADFTADYGAFSDFQLPRLSRLRAVVRMTHWRTRVLVADGQAEEAAERWLDVLRMSRLHQSEPGMVSYLVTLAAKSVALDGLHRALLAGAGDDELYAAIDAELARHDDAQLLERVLRQERAISVSASVAQAWNSPVPLKWLVGWPMKRHFLGPLDYYEHILPRLARPWTEVRETFMPTGDEPTPTGFGPLADLLHSSFQAAVRANRRSTATVRSLRAINALLQYTVANGREAGVLSDLDLPVEAFSDPFGDGPLKAKRTAAGWLVYSVGENGVDDGGVLRDQLDVGIGPPQVTDDADDPEADDSQEE